MKLSRVGPEVPVEPVELVSRPRATLPLAKLASVKLLIVVDEVMS